MTNTMNKTDKEGFILFCRHATNSQLLNIIRKELRANRRDYATLAKAEAERRILAHE